MKRQKSSLSNIDTIKCYLKGERPYTQISNHISEKEKYRNEGEEWEISGIKYKQKDGKAIQLTKTQGDIIRESIGKSLDCKLCGAQWNLAGTLDRKFLMRTRLCQDCLIDYETKLRILGIYDSYEKYRLSSYELGSLKENKSKLIEVVDYFTKTDGDFVQMAENEYDETIIWKNTNKDKILKDAQEDLKRIKKLISSGTKIVKEYKKQYVDNISKYNLPDIIMNK